VLFSVIVAVVDSGAALDRCLAALAAQQDAPPLEILVPFDATVPDVPDVCRRFPGVRAIAMGTVPTERRPDSLAGQHELVDLRRSAGLREARGDLVAMLEDRGAPAATWARELARLHTEQPAAAVVGGAVTNVRDTPLAWAVYLNDFGRFQPPFPSGPQAWVTDINLCYKRAALDSTRAIWAERFHETTLHWELQRQGASLFLSPAPVVEQRREGLTLAGLLEERLEWGRLFGYTRAREHPGPVRFAFAALAPALPLLLFARIARRQVALPSRGAFLRAAPALLLLLAAWSAGEALGYLTKRA
jgi:hypothetical protein